MHKETSRFMLCQFSDRVQHTVRESFLAVGCTLPEKIHIMNTVWCTDRPLKLFLSNHPRILSPGAAPWEMTAEPFLFSCQMQRPAREFSRFQGPVKARVLLAHKFKSVKTNQWLSNFSRSFDWYQIYLFESRRTVPLNNRALFAGLMIFKY